jgi:hypothetical protein
VTTTRRWHVLMASCLTTKLALRETTKLADQTLSRPSSRFRLESFYLWMAGNRGAGHYDRVGQRKVLIHSSNPNPDGRFCSHATWARDSGSLSDPLSIMTYWSASLLIGCLQCLQSITSGIFRLLISNASISIKGNDKISIRQSP